MLFFRRQYSKINTNGKRVVLLIGGGGTLGKALLQEKPKDVFVINISKTSIPRKENTITCHFDISRDAHQAMQHVAWLVDSVDVLINAAVAYHRVDLKDLEKKEFIDGFVLNTFVPMELSRLAGRYFWSHDSPEQNAAHARKVINISSGSAYGSDTMLTPIVRHGTRLALYSGTKAALNIMTEYLHEYVKKDGVSAHIVAPGSLLRPEILSATVKVIWELQSKKTDTFSLQKVW